MEYCCYFQAHLESLMRILCLFNHFALRRTNNINNTLINTSESPLKVKQKPPNFDSLQIRECNFKEL